MSILSGGDLDDDGVDPVREPVAPPLSWWPAHWPVRNLRCLPWASLWLL